MNNVMEYESEGFWISPSGMLYPGSLLGPYLWKLFFGIARLAINVFLVPEVVFEDILNGFRLGSATEDAWMGILQERGKANQA